MKITVDLSRSEGFLEDRGQIAFDTWHQADRWLKERYFQLFGNQEPTHYAKTQIEVRSEQPEFTFDLRYDLGSEQGDRDRCPCLALRVASGMRSVGDFYLKVPELRSHAEEKYGCSAEQLRISLLLYAEAVLEDYQKECSALYDIPVS